MEKYTIDATGKKLGRVASEAAAYLLGKNRADFSKNKVAAAKVEITNASKTSITGKKLSETQYARYSGYPGGLRKPQMKEIAVKKGFQEIFRIAVYGMLPGNKLRAQRMKNLTVKD